MFTVRKRNGKKEAFDVRKIASSITKAGAFFSSEVVKNIYGLFDDNNCINSETIRSVVENYLVARNETEAVKAYIEFNTKRDSAYESSWKLLNGNNRELQYENSNKNVHRIPIQRDLMAGEVSKQISETLIFSEDVMEAHRKGLIHVHDLDYRANPIFNCCLLNLEDMLTNGTVLNDVRIDPPKTFRTACTITTQILAQVTSSQYGGTTVTLAHLAPFIDKSRTKLQKEVAKMSLTRKEKDKWVEEKLKQEIKDGVQTLQYQTVTIMGSNGQAVFLSVVMDTEEVPKGRLRDDLVMLIEEVLNQRMQGVKNEYGKWVAPAFPKLLYVLNENNVHDTSPYYWLTTLSAKCTSKRMVPDYISSKVAKELKGTVVPPMGCRSFLSVEPNHTNEDGTPKLYGRFNQGVVTINLPFVALSSLKKRTNFWDELDDALELCHKALKQGHERLEGTLSDVSPIHWQYGGLARLKKGETIDKLLHDNYSTISLGFAGLSECTYAIEGCSHTSDYGAEFALDVMQMLVMKCEMWKAEEGIAYGVYGSPIESTTGAFADALKKNFGVIPHVSDKDYVTNSYHVHVTEEIPWNKKLMFESEFQKLSTAGAISYIEAPNLSQNIEVILSIIKFIYHNIMYAEINLRLDNCHECGFEGESEIVEDGQGNLIFRCPVCGNTNESTLSVVRRTTGYLGTQRWSHGRTSEIRDRVFHI